MDWGSEFGSRFTWHLEDLGIDHKHIPVGCPEANGGCFDAGNLGVAVKCETCTHFAPRRINRSSKLPLWSAASLLSS